MNFNSKKEYPSGIAVSGFLKGVFQMETAKSKLFAIKLLLFIKLVSWFPQKTYSISRNCLVSIIFVNFDWKIIYQSWISVGKDGSKLSSSVKNKNLSTLYFPLVRLLSI